MSDEIRLLQVKIHASVIQSIEDWRFENRVPSRAEAIRRLIQIGLKAKDEGK